MPSRYDGDVKINDGVFGDSLAGKHLVQMLREANDRKLVSRMSRHWDQYLQGLNDIMPVRNASQKTLLLMWRDRFVQSGREQFASKFEANNIPFTYYENVLAYRLKKAMDLGPLYQKLDS